MTVNTKEMAGVPVETRSGQAVGKVASFDLDGASGHMTTLHVKTRGLMAGLTADELLVSWASVIELTPAKVIIADGAVTVGAESLARVNTTLAAPTLMKES